MSSQYVGCSVILSYLRPFVVVLFLCLYSISSPILHPVAYCVVIRSCVVLFCIVGSQYWISL